MLEKHMDIMSEEEFNRLRAADIVMTELARMLKVSKHQFDMPMGVYGPPCPQFIYVGNAVENLKNDVDTLMENLHSIGN